MSYYTFIPFRHFYQAPSKFRGGYQLWGNALRRWAEFQCCWSFRSSGARTTVYKLKSTRTQTAWHQGSHSFALRPPVASRQHLSHVCRDQYVHSFQAQLRPASAPHP